MSDVFSALRSDLAARLPEGAAVRFSRGGDSLFMADLRRFPPLSAPALWRARGAGGLWFFSPEWALVERICRDEAPENPFSFPPGPMGRFAALLFRYREEGEADAAFVLALLRTLGGARMGQKAEALLPPVKAAYARCLAEKKKARTAQTALIALEAALVLEGTDP